MFVGSPIGATLMKFEKKFEDSQFLEVMKEGNLYTASFMAGRVGATVTTAKRALSRLEALKLVEIVPINEGESDLLIYKRK
jgi:DNA-binding MarR family transcriptional regulator